MIEVPPLLPVVPEIFVLSMACLILVVDLFLTERTRVITYLLSQATLIVGAFLVGAVYAGGRVLTLNDTFVNDAMATVLKVALLLTTAVVFLYSVDYLRTRKLMRGEYFVLGLFGVLGMMVMVSAHNFLTIYLGLELLALSLYAMVALQRDSADACEAAMKYFVLGALASGMLLYGMSMVYGITGSLDLAEIGAKVTEGANSGVLVFGLVFIVIGLAFKLGAVPFHMWVPDVYQGAPTSVTLYLGTAPKIAAFAMAIRLLDEGFGGLLAQWQEMLMILAVLSMAIGNVVAIAQQNIKRMLAYSTISHVGFLMLGLLAGTPDGYAAGMFYAVTYAVMAAGGFGMIILLSRAGFEADRIDDFRGLNDRSPWFALMMMLVMLGMAGVPPTVGFYAKLAVLEAVIAVDQIWLAIVAVVFSIIGAFYYLRVIKLMYFDKPVDTAMLTPTMDMRLLLSANGLAVLGLGIFPGTLMAICAAAFGG